MSRNIRCLMAQKGRTGKIFLPILCAVRFRHAGVAELVDALDSKSSF
jgi:hypothetical protein